MEKKTEKRRSKNLGDAARSVVVIAGEDRKDSLLGYKRRRTFEATDLDIAAYYKKPKDFEANFLSKDDDLRKKLDVDVSNEALKVKWDLMWCFDVITNLNKDTPMWTGWNSKLLPKSTELQGVWYLPQLNESPTSYSVVAETLRRSLATASANKKDSISTTYDLAIAKMAWKIQQEEKPIYNKVFVTLGSFHVEMAFHSAIGKLIAESGGPFVLNESGVLAKGSLKSFQTGKNYKRCKRLHDLLAISLRSLHFEAFLISDEASRDLSDELRSELNILHKHGNITTFTFSAEVDKVFERYQAFCEKTRLGELGKTAQYWMHYTDLIDLNHKFSRSIRSGDFRLYIGCLPELATIFFAFNHQNYSRWIMKYHNDLLKLPKSHPDVYKEFQNGRFSIQRTTRNFSKHPIDLTLEQTINRDASRQGGGIASMTNSIS